MEYSLILSKLAGFSAFRAVIVLVSTVKMSINGMWPIFVDKHNISFDLIPSIINMQSLQFSLLPNSKEKLEKHYLVTYVTNVCSLCAAFSADPK